MVGCPARRRPEPPSPDRGDPPPGGDPGPATRVDPGVRPSVGTKLVWSTRGPCSARSDGSSAGASRAGRDSLEISEPRPGAPAGGVRRAHGLPGPTPGARPCRSSSERRMRPGGCRCRGREGTGARRRSDLGAPWDVPRGRSAHPKGLVRWSSFAQARDQGPMTAGPWAGPGLRPRRPCGSRRSGGGVARPRQVDPRQAVVRRVVDLHPAVPASDHLDPTGFGRGRLGAVGGGLGGGHGTKRGSSREGIREEPGSHMNHEGTLLIDGPRGDWPRRSEKVRPPLGRGLSASGAD